MQVHKHLHRLAEIASFKQNERSEIINAIDFTLAICLNDIYEGKVGEKYGSTKLTTNSNFN